MSKLKPYTEKFTYALDNLKNSLDKVYNRENAQETCYIVSLSRKGPRLLEKLFEGEARHEWNTVTEFALPFLFSKIANDTQTASTKTKIKLYIVDDAIYYGSTIESIYNEIMTYARLYGLQVEPVIHTCIMSQKAKPSVKEMGVDAVTDIPAGFEHFFVKNLTSSLRSLNKCLEVEFPMVTYRFEDKIDWETLKQKIEKKYGEGHTYVIKHPRMYSPEENVMYAQKEDVENINIILDNQGAQFKKLRIYVADNELRIACMAPRCMYSDYNDFSVQYYNTDLNSIWDRIYQTCCNPDELKAKMSSDEKLSNYRTLKHNCLKTLVALSNYFESYNMLIESKDKLNDIFASLSNGFSFEGVKEQDLFYLLGDKEMCSRIKEILDSLYERGDKIKSNINRTETPDIGYQVFEYGFPETLMSELSFRNGVLLDKCQSTQEVLSLLFYNQMLIMGNSARSYNQLNGNSRLRLGYTFLALYNELQRNPNISPKDLGKELYRWMDRRIDQGCIVPQYVHDPKSNEWVRGFRHGENEDSVLGQLTRFTAFCFDKLDKRIGAGWVPKKVLSDMLTLSYLYSDSEAIKRRLGLEIDIQNHELFFYNDDADVSKKASRNLIKYMEEMAVLIETDRGYTISPNLDNLDVKTNTALGDGIEDEIDSFIKTTLDKAQGTNLHIFDLPAYTNLLFINKNYKFINKNYKQEFSDFINKGYPNDLVTFEHFLAEWKENLNEEKETTEKMYDFLKEKDEQINNLIVQQCFWKDYTETDSVSMEKFESFQKNILNFKMAIHVVYTLYMQRYDNLQPVIKHYLDESIWGKDVIDRDFITTMENIITDRKDDSFTTHLVDAVERFIKKLKVDFPEKKIMADAK